MDFRFVQPGFLIGMAALAIPLVIHLLFRRRPRRLSIGSIRFLNQIIQQSRSRRKFMRWLLLAMRLCAVGLFILLFSRPYLAEPAEHRGGGLLAVLIDRSASMQLRADGQRLVDIAVAQARELVRERGAGRRVEIAFFDNHVYPLGTSSSAADQLQNLAVQREHAPALLYGSTDFADALRWARDICVAAQESAQELHLFTDLQQSGLEWSDFDPLPAQVRVQVHELGRDLPNNLAVIDATPDRCWVRPGETTSVRVAVLSTGPSARDEVSVVVSLSSGVEQVRQQQKVRLEAGSITFLEYELPPLSAGLWSGAATVEMLDDLPFDNQRHLAIWSAPPYRVLIVDGDPHAITPLSESFFVEAALRLDPSQPSSAASPYFPLVTRSVDGAGDFSSYDHIILANVGRMARSTAERLADFVRAGGGLIVFTGDQVTASSSGALADAGLVPGAVRGPVLSDELPWRVEWWNRDHSIFEPFNDPQHGDLTRLSFRGLTEVQLAPATQVLASVSGGRPWIVQPSVPGASGTVLWVLTACDGDWGQWPRGRLFVPLVHQLLGDVTGLNDGGPVRPAMLDPSAGALDRTAPGVFQRAGHWEVVNVNPRESEAERCSLEDFANRFELHLTSDHSQPELEPASAAYASMELRPNELWHWVLFTLVVLLSLEVVVANRTTA